jgi:hypothetical protein
VCVSFADRLPAPIEVCAYYLRDRVETVGGTFMVDSDRGHEAAGIANCRPQRHRKHFGDFSGQCVSPNAATTLGDLTTDVPR